MSYKSGFDPENDPVVYTTDDGLVIRYANDFKSSHLAGYTYFTMGKYNGIPVNWVIIGYNPSLNHLVGEYTGSTHKNPTEGGNSQMSTIDGTPAGLAILKDMFAISQAATSAAKVQEDCVYCISECILFDTQFYTSSQNAKYEGSYLQSVCENLPTTLGLTTQEKDMIFPVNVTYRYLNSTDGTTSQQEFFYPPAARASWDNLPAFFSNHVAYNLGTSTADTYWSRDGAFNSSRYQYGVYYNADGNLVADSGMSVTSSCGVRPCCMIEVL